MTSHPTPAPVAAAKMATCPFCARSSHLAICNDGVISWVVCGYCGTEGPLGETAPEAIAAWNTRAAPAQDAAMAAKVERLTAENARQRKALKEALATAVLSIAFLGRDAQTARQDKTLDQLCDMWVKIDSDLRAALEARTDG